MKIKRKKGKKKKCNPEEFCLFNLSALTKISGEGGGNKFVLLSSDTPNQMEKNTLPVPPGYPEVVQASREILMCVA